MVWNICEGPQLFVSQWVILPFFPPTQEFGITVVYFLMLLNTNVKRSSGFVLCLCVLNLVPWSMCAAAWQVKQVCSTILCSVEKLPHKFLYSPAPQNIDWVTQGAIIYFSFLLSLILDKNGLSYKILRMSKTEIQKVIKFSAYNNLDKTCNSLFLRRLNIW